MLEKLLRGRQLPEDGREVLLQTVATLLLADRCDLNAHHRPMLLRAVSLLNFVSYKMDLFFIVKNSLKAPQPAPVLLHVANKPWIKFLS